MHLRSVARWLALAASLVAAALPPAAVARTVCTETGRAAVAICHGDGCALAAANDRSSCCDPDDGTPDDGTPDDGAPDDGAPDHGDCCRTSPVLAPAFPPDGDDAAAVPDPAPIVAQHPVESTGPETPAPRGGLLVSATGPPDHALRRLLEARRVDVLTM